MRPEVKNGRGAHSVIIGNVPSLERFQAIPNGKSRLKVEVSSTAMLNAGGDTFVSVDAIRVVRKN